MLDISLRGSCRNLRMCVFSGISYSMMSMASTPPRGLRLSRINAAPFRSHYRKRLPCFSDANLATFACVVFLLSLCRFESYIQMPNWCLSGLMDKKQQSGGGMMPPGAQFVPDIWSNVPSMEL